MSISVQVTGTNELQRYQQLMENLGDPKHKEELLDALGGIVESQTRRRIADEKSSPDGKPWAEWNAAYAKTRHGNQSLLQGDGDLLDSIQYVVERNQVRIGSPLAYAAVHQDGFSGAVQVDAHTRLITQAFGKALAFPVYQSVGAFSRLMNIPQREFLGLSTDNQKEVYSVLGNFFEGLMQ
ncbi:phage virion morphogenesis protein [Shewanella sp. M16]|uniref:phage virion morphogenesis protein n=1 Tax=Shewanella sp. M16 TaxID=2830837 RepID=UPI001BAE5641|nr:phage virion morphogenesis protein [Shewanella sp. M16]MBS0044507.1 phage virion morphogenesis protein [Shewanella sp. M16]QYW06278.1 virion morphogenesis protein [Shewanella phage vB_SspM_MuM16-2]